MIKFEVAKRKYVNDYAEELLSCKLFDSLEEARNFVHNGVLNYNEFYVISKWDNSPNGIIEDIETITFFDMYHIDYVSIMSANLTSSGSGDYWEDKRFYIPGNYEPKQIIKFIRDIFDDADDIFNKNIKEGGFTKHLNGRFETNVECVDSSKDFVECVLSISKDW